jgi:hypothetical protein
MGKIAKQINPNAEMNLPDKPPGMHWTKYAALPSALSIKATSGR